MELKQQLCQIDIKLEDLNEYLGEKHYIEYKDHFKKTLFRGIERYPFGSNSNQNDNNMMNIFVQQYFFEYSSLRGYIFKKHIQFIKFENKMN